MTRAAPRAGTGVFGFATCGSQSPQQGIAASSVGAVSISGQQEAHSAPTGTARKASARTTTTGRRCTKDILPQARLGGFSRGP